jgi:hypothetical protein
LDFTLEHIPCSLSGSNGLDRSLDYVLQLTLPARQLHDPTQEVLQRISGKTLDLLPDEAIVLDVLLGGTVNKPEVKVSAKDIVKSTAKQLTRMAQQAVQEKKTALEDTVRAEIQRQKQELERLKKEAEEQANREKERLKKEAERRLKGLLR